MSTLRDYRHEAILTQEELAQQVGVNKLTIYSWERGETLPRPSHIRKLAEVLGRTPQEIRQAVLVAQEGYRAKEQEKRASLSETTSDAA